MSDSLKPMLSATYEERFAPTKPVLSSAKLDGFRCLIVDGVPMTRSLKKPLPNLHVRAALSGLPWFDGELLVGNPTDPGVLRATQSGINSEDGEPDWAYYVFDMCDPSLAARPFHERLNTARSYVNLLLNPRIKLLEHRLCRDVKEIFHCEGHSVEAGYEGLMIRDPDGPYKWGRATAKSGLLTKIKRWQDAEAEIIGVYEEEENQNEAKKNALGRTERSSHKANKVGKGNLGGYHCKTYWGGGGPLLAYFALDGCTEMDPVLFDCGAAANMTEIDRRELWANREHLVGRIITFKYQHRKGADAPSHPVFKAFKSDE